MSWTVIDIILVYVSGVCEAMPDDFLLPQGQPARVMNALDMMRDMTLNEETISGSNSLETVQEGIRNDQPHQTQPKSPTKKGLSGRRAISMSTTTPPVGLKSPSTSAVTGKSTNHTLSPHSPGPAHSKHPRLRSYSVGAKLPRRPHTSCAKTRERQRKIS